MRQYDEKNLVIRRGGSPDPDVLVEVSPESAGWDTLAFQARKLAAARSWSSSTEGRETALVVLGGRVSVRSGQGSWKNIGARPSVFAGLPYALYFPPGREFAVTAETDCEFAVASVPAEGGLPPRLVEPRDIAVEIRGGDHATRHINSILPPGFPCRRLVVVEVYTPGGNWSSYPPHKHDVHRADADGRLIEADLDEIYYYRIDRPEGYALQRIYTGSDSPLALAGYPIDSTVMARDSDVVLVPEGYHPVSSPVGFTTYYLNVLAGSAQSLACSDDPLHAWIKGSYLSLDPRVPIYDVSEGKESK